MDREAWEYFEKHKRQAVNIALPEREESEPNITEEQIEELKAITDGSLTYETLKNLGRWQAACAIKKLKEAKERLSARLGIEYMAQKKKSENRPDTIVVRPYKLYISAFPVIGYNPALGFVLGATFNPAIWFGNPKNTPIFLMGFS